MPLTCLGSRHKPVCNVVPGDLGTVSPFVPMQEERNLVGVPEKVFALVFVVDLKPGTVIVMLLPE